MVGKERHIFVLVLVFSVINLIINKRHVTTTSKVQKRSFAFGKYFHVSKVTFDVTLSASRIFSYFNIASIKDIIYIDFIQLINYILQNYR